MAVAPLFAIAAVAVSAYAAQRAGSAAADASKANAITAGAQGDAAGRIGNANADLITQQGDFNAQVIADRTAFNAEQIGRSITDQRAATDLALRQQETQGVMRIGAQRAAAAASGITLEGSPLEVMAFQAEQNELERLSVFTQGRAQVLDLMAQREATLRAGAADISATRYDTAMRALTARATGQMQAAGFQSQVPIYMAQSRASQTAGTFGAASAILGGVGRYGSDALPAAQTAGNWISRQVRP